MIIYYLQLLLIVNRCCVLFESIIERMNPVVGGSGGPINHARLLEGKCVFIDISSGYRLLGKLKSFLSVIDTVEYYKQ